MAERTRRPSIRILDGTVTLNPPTPNRKTWAINWRDPITGKQRNASGGHTREEAELRAMEKTGWNIPNHLRRKPEAPTLSEAFENWMEKNRHRWNPRTWDNYQYVARGIINTLGDQKLNTLTPAQISTIENHNLSREQQIKVRSMVRGVLKDNDEWTLYDPEKFAQSVKIRGNATSNRSYTIAKGDIPVSKYVNSVIVCAYSTSQQSPIEGIRPDPHWRHSPLEYTDGLPDEITKPQRRKPQKHYRNLEQFRKNEDEAIASRYRQLGLIVALGAGGGLRIGEILALRVRHFLTVTQLTSGEIGHLENPINTAEPIWGFYQGHVTVEEQASQASKGKIWITRPKGRSGGKTRIVNLPALLPSATGEYQKTIRNQISGGKNPAIPRFADNRESLWSLTHDEARQLWQIGYPPLAWLLWKRISELWNSDIIQKAANPREQVQKFRKLLLFPTKTAPRRGRDGQPNALTDPSWTHDVSIVEGTGGYQSTSNLASKYMNPLLDYVSNQMDYYPAHRTNSDTRKGWTHHGFRHYAIQTMMESPTNIPLTQISEQAGHASVAFTLARYAHPQRHHKTDMSNGLEL